MHDAATGAPIRTCFQPFIFRYPAANLTTPPPANSSQQAQQLWWYAYCFDVSADRATVWVSDNGLRSWRHWAGAFPYRGQGLGRIRWVLYNSKNREYVGFSQDYTQRFHVFTAPTAVGPFTFR